MPEHCQDVHICLIGTNRFQHELLVSSLKKIHDCRCTFTTAASLSEIPDDKWSKLGRTSLVFVDCFNLSRDELPPLLHVAYQKLLPENRLVLFNLSQGTGIERAALNFGVRGFFYPHDTTVAFCLGTRAILRGEIRLSRKMLSEVVLSDVHEGSQPLPLEQARLASLSRREKDVLCELATGASNSDIADTLCISPHTVRTHLCTIFKKINVSTRSHATLWATKNLPNT